jgi:hypothetical protein
VADPYILYHTCRKSATRHHKLDRTCRKSATHRHKVQKTPYMCPPAPTRPAGQVCQQSTPPVRHRCTQGWRRSVADPLHHQGARRATPHRVQTGSATTSTHRTQAYNTTFLMLLSGYKRTIRVPMLALVRHLCDPVLTALGGTSTPIIRGPDASRPFWLQTRSPLGLAVSVKYMQAGVILCTASLLPQSRWAASSLSSGSLHVHLCRTCRQGPGNTTAYPGGAAVFTSHIVRADARQAKLR